jgi:hypothetical protein
MTFRKKKIDKSQLKQLPISRMDNHENQRKAISGEGVD